MAFKNKTNENFAPTNMSNAGDVKRGTIPSEGSSAVNYAAPYDNSLPLLQVGGWIAQGSIVHLSAGNRLTPGMPAGTEAFAMPMMVYGQGSNEPSSKTNSQFTVTSTLPPFMPWKGTPEAGYLTAFPMCSGYEFASSEYIINATTTADSYTPNTPLTSVSMINNTDDTSANYSANALTDAKEAGMLKPGTLWEDHIIGFVSEGIIPYRNVRPMLCFWGVPLPSHQIATASSSAASSSAADTGSSSSAADTGSSST